jgi:hypothetical protein
MEIHKYLANYSKPLLKTLDVSCPDETRVEAK